MLEVLIQTLGWGIDEETDLEGLFCFIARTEELSGTVEPVTKTM
jgi:hypothetical protein